MTNATEHGHPPTTDGGGASVRPAGPVSAPIAGSLLGSRRFLPLFATQLLSAFTDNFLKNAVVLLILFGLAGEGGPELVPLAGAIFVLPFVFLSALGGQVADRNDKAVVARRLKLAEIGAAALAVAGLHLASVPLMFLALFAFGTVSAMFGPVKYGILPDHLAPEDLPRANAWIEGATFFAILSGTVGAGLLSGTDAARGLVGPVVAALAVACWLCSFAIPTTGAGDPASKVDPNVLRSTWRETAALRRDGRLFSVAMMQAWFWTIGAVCLSILPILVRDSFGGDQGAVTLCLAVFAVAVAVGSAVAAALVRGRVVLLPVPVGAVMMAAFSADLAWTTWNMAGGTADGLVAGAGGVRSLVDLAGIAFSGALVAVPSMSALQAWADPERRARTVAASNIVSAVGMAGAGLAVAGAQAAGISIPAVLAALAVLNLVAGAVMFAKLPTRPLLDIASIYFRVFHRMEVRGLANVAKAGRRMILAPNHTSFLDGPLALALTDADPVFAVNTEIAKRWWAKPFLARTRAMPLDPTKPIATRTLVRAVQAGDPIVIFPEGRISVTGSLMKVYDGAAMVADKTGAPVVPVRIDGLERSPLSRMKDGQVRRKLFPKVVVTIGEPRTISVDPELRGARRRAAAGSALYEVMADTVVEASDTDRTVARAVVDAARKFGTSTNCAEDPKAGRMSYGKLLLASSVLARKTEALLEDDETHVGLMLPSSVGALVTFLALTRSGRIPAMVNFTAGAANVASGMRACRARTILTSKAFVDQGKLQPLVDALASEFRVVWLEDVKADVSTLDKLLGFLGRNRVASKAKPDDAAVVLFTSGSEGKPKGVVLTHRNMLANAAQAAARISFDRSDKVLNILPMFHSFGLTAATILPITHGVPVYFYPSPLHYRIVPEIAYGSNATIMFGTDTFLAGYARTANAYDFRSMRYVFSGAEPVKETTRKVWAEKFDVRLLEGYGVTECSPVVALNTPLFNKAGTVGRLMPGMEHRLEAVDGVETGGRLHVRGPNVMLGYLREENPGVLEPLVDGWHDTGDVVDVDAEGFVRILGRAKRFAKIGGEMVSLAALEALAAEFWPGKASAAAVVKDPKKGEAIVLLTEQEGADRLELARFLKSKNASDLMAPSRIVEGAIPLLGTGKVDFAEVGRRLVA